MLHAHFSFTLWAVTRAQGDDVIVLDAIDHGYGIAAGHVAPWGDTLCSLMVEGLGPRLAAQVDLVPAYASARAVWPLPIGSYLGVPLELEDGSLFGTLSAIDPLPQPGLGPQDLAPVELFARLLSSLLAARMREDEQARRTSLAELEALTDPLTGIPNRRGWERFLAAEDERCARLGSSAAVVVVDLDDLKEINDRQGHLAGDALIRATTATLVQTARGEDLVARIGGDEFCILGMGCGDVASQALAARIDAGLERAGISASVGVAHRRPTGGLVAAWHEADAAMYRSKAERRNARSAPTKAA